MFAAQACNGCSRSATRRITSRRRRDSIGARARARGVSPLEEAYDRLLDDDGHAMLLVTLANFRDGSLDTVAELVRRDDVVLGLGDGGAHYGMICDAAFPTYMLTHWVRDRASGRLSVAEAVRELTSVPARVAGLADRGRIAPGLQGRSQRHRRTARCGCTSRWSPTTCPRGAAGSTRPPTGTSRPWCPAR